MSKPLKNSVQREKMETFAVISNPENRAVRQQACRAMQREYGL
jgi:hypothetical protein